MRVEPRKIRPPATGVGLCRTCKLPAAQWPVRLSRSRLGHRLVEGPGRGPLKCTPISSAGTLGPPTRWAELSASVRPAPARPSCGHRPHQASPRASRSRWAVAREPGADGTAWHPRPCMRSAGSRGEGARMRACAHTRVHCRVACVPAHGFVRAQGGGWAGGCEGWRGETPAGTTTRAASRCLFAAPCRSAGAAARGTATGSPVSGAAHRWRITVARVRVRIAQSLCAAPAQPGRRRC